MNCTNPSLNNAIMFYMWYSNDPLDKIWCSIPAKKKVHISHVQFVERLHDTGFVRQDYTWGSMNHT